MECSQPGRAAATFGAAASAPIVRSGRRPGRNLANFGLLSFAVLDYSTRFTDPVVAAYFRPPTDPLVTAGTLFQPIRGVLLCAVVFLLREPLFHRRHGWLALLPEVVLQTLLFSGVLFFWVHHPEKKWLTRVLLVLFVLVLALTGFAFIAPRPT